MSDEKRTNRLSLRNERIAQRFQKLSEKNFSSKRLYTNEAIFAMLSEEFFLSEITIEKIVFGRVQYKT